MASNLPSPRKTTRLASAKVEVAALWAVERWNERPGLPYHRLISEICGRFERGKTFAEQAIKRANEIFRERAATLLSQERISNHLHRLAESAERKGNEVGAARIYESIARVRGVAEPLGIEHSGVVANVDAKMASMSTAQLEALAALEGDEP